MRLGLGSATPNSNPNQAPVRVPRSIAAPLEELTLTLTLILALALALALTLTLTRTLTLTLTRSAPSGRRSVLQRLAGYHPRRRRRV